jgi:pyruvate/2-oxoglutarate dehydrogenase complex dihydrolipoamide acyltransferase (E2) component
VLAAREEWGKMVYEIRIPELGEEADAAAIVAWSVKEGEPVESGDVLCEIEAGKSVQQVTSPGRGILRAVLQDEGTLLAPGTLLAIVADPADDISAHKAK